MLRCMVTYQGRVDMASNTGDITRYTPEQDAELVRRAKVRMVNRTGWIWLCLNEAAGGGPTYGVPATASESYWAPAPPGETPYSGPSRLLKIWRTLLKPGQPHQERWTPRALWPAEKGCALVSSSGGSVARIGWVAVSVRPEAQGIFSCA